MTVELDVAKRCASCDAPLHGVYCSACGERRLDPGDHRLRRFLEHALESATNLDARLPRTLITLVRRPGMLTAEFMHGRRRPWLSPLQLFLIINLAYFVLLSLFGGFNTFTTRLQYHPGQFGYGGLAADMIARIGEPGSPELEEFRRRFDESIPRYANSLIIIMIPLFAAAVAALRPRAGAYFVQHLVLTLHFFAFVLLASLGIGYFVRFALATLPAAAWWMEDEILLTLVVLVVFAAWLMPAFRRAYGTTRTGAVVRGVVAALALFPLIMIYRAILFFVVYHAVR